MVIPLAVLLVHDPRLFEQVLRNLAVDDLVRAAEVQVHVLAEPRGVVVPHGLGVAKRLHDRAGVEQQLRRGARAARPARPSTGVKPCSFLG